MGKKSLLGRAESARRAGAAPARGYDRRQANGISLWIVVVVAIALAAYMAVELSVDPVAVDSGKLRVFALFGYSLPLSELRELKLEKEPIVAGKRVFGNDAFGLFREGDYEVDGLGRARVFLKRPNVSYLSFSAGDRSYALSLGSLEKDQLLYNRIVASEK
jgi:hypothetical protein